MSIKLSNKFDNVPLICSVIAKHGFEFKQCEDLAHRASKGFGIRVLTNKREKPYPIGLFRSRIVTYWDHIFTVYPQSNRVVLVVYGTKFVETAEQIAKEIADLTKQDVKVTVATSSPETQDNTLDVLRGHHGYW